ncbi:Conserved hypothetical protein [Mycoplasma mycoides subsp. capri LC str. 95010]|uniref:Abortive infection bacteriophage resistance protein n=1 Tax=Mycoplasma mycoides subsp. capri LC str. 95010 TaxID=862259 RepID=F4MQF7_MYCML|nr:Abi family protein [Mycoplasma mycoides]CBW54340.1 Conserved hypothetical protein [Mycoplasma mycoides subsp. capri LC str. 95010]
MKSIKEFKTFSEQIQILKSRGLIIKNESKAIKFLEHENYYNVINAYKDLFLKDNKIDFKENTNFDEIESLFLFDKELRSIILNYILSFERSFKTIMAYKFSEKYSKNNQISCYMLHKNYDNKKYLNALEFISTVNKAIIDKSKKSDYVNHYINQYGDIPLWVVVNVLTLGNMGFMFNILKNDDKNEIIRFYTERYKKEHNLLKLNSIMNDTTFSTGLKILNIVRNICAHEERLYNLNFKHKMKEISNIVNYENYDNSKLISIFIFLKLVLDYNEFSKMKTKLINLFDMYKLRFKTINFFEILYEMGIELDSFKKF